VNPLPFLWSQLKLSWFGTALVVLLTALAVALGIAGSLLEHGLRQGSARAADDFDLIIAAPGSQSQVVLRACEFIMIKGASWFAVCDDS